MSQKYRVFVAINLPEDIKKKLTDYQEKWPEIPIKWTKKENIHITLIFLGYLNSEELLEICKITKEAASRHSSFSVKLNKICYGPPKKMPPRMIWAEGEKSEKFAALRDDLSKLLNIREAREFSPHITLGRVRQMEWRRIEPEERPEVERDIDLTFEVNSIEIMESELKRGGPEYTILESAVLND